MSYYDDVYSKRLNRYGLNYQSRITAQRERNFEQYLLKTLSHVTFSYDGKTIHGSLERYQQDDSKTIAYLLTKLDAEIASGALLDIYNDKDEQTTWLVWWNEFDEGKGYNRYVILRVDKTTIDNNDIYYYLIGPKSNKIKDTLKSSKNSAVYFENENLYMLITPYNDFFVKGKYLEFTYQQTICPFTISGIDVLSNRGIMYISLNPVPKQEKQEEKNIDTSNQQQSFWLTGGM